MIVLLAGVILYAFLKARRRAAASRRGHRPRDNPATEAQA